jgi:hypothetical protein
LGSKKPTVQDLVRSMFFVAGGLLCVMFMFGNNTA